MTTPSDQSLQYERYMADMDVYPISLDEIERYAKLYRPEEVMGQRTNPECCPIANMLKSYGYGYVYVCAEHVVLGNSIRSCVPYRTRGGISSLVYKITAVPGDRRYSESFNITAQQVLDIIQNIRDTRGEA